MFGFLKLYGDEEPMEVHENFPYVYVRIHYTTITKLSYRVLSRVFVNFLLALP